jgi:hypothetical protein
MRAVTCSKRDGDIASGSDLAAPQLDLLAAGSPQLHEPTASASAAAVWIEIDSEPEDGEQAQTVTVRAPTKTIATLPVIVRPIPKRASEQLYEEAYKLGMELHAIHSATEFAQAWEQKWHPQTKWELPSRDGAKNPSPCNVTIDEHIASMKNSKRRNLNNLCNLSTNSNESKHKRNLNSRRKMEELQQQPRATATRANTVVSPLSDHEDGGGVVESTMSRVVRPVAVRIARPIHRIPAELFLHCHEHHVHSPLTHLSNSSFTLQNLGGVQTFKPEQVHYIHPQDNEDEPTRNIIRQTSPTLNIIRQPSPTTSRQAAVQCARDGILEALAAHGGDYNSPEFNTALDFLKADFYERRETVKQQATEGLWLSLTKPTFFGNLGTNEQGDPMYTLGRMAFDMFSPANLVCSLQGSFNEITQVKDHHIRDAIPKSLKDEVLAGQTILRTYNIVTAFTIEPNDSYADAPSNQNIHHVGIKGIMTTRGYTLEDPKEPHRSSVWITGGTIQPNDTPYDKSAWLDQFTRHPPTKSFGERWKPTVLAVKLLMGAHMCEGMNAQDGSMEYTFERPIGGHNMAYVDTVYLDETLRVVRGHRGTIFVFSKLADTTQSRGASL